MSGRTPEYEAYPGLANSYLTSIYDRMHWGTGELEVNDDVLLFGSLFHTATLEAQNLARELEQRFEGSTAPKSWISRILAMRESALAVWDFRCDLEDPWAIIEEARYGSWRGHRSKGICDLRVAHKGLIWDLKSTSCTSHQRFVEYFDKYGYWRQAVFYKILTRARNLKILGVQKTSPFKTYLVDTSMYPSKLAQAKRQFTQIMRYYRTLPESHATALEA